MKIERELGEIAYMKEPKGENGGKGSSSFRQRLGQNQLGWRLFVGFICLLAIAAFIHFREARIETLELGSKASRFVVSQVDFEFPDDESTLIFRQDALRDIGAIYKLNEREVSETRFDFENFLIQNRDWKSEVPNLTFEELYKAADAFEDVLIESRFTDARTLQKMREFGLPTTYMHVYTPLDQDKPFSLPDKMWGQMEKMTSRLDRFNASALDYVVDFFSRKKWRMGEDVTLVSSFRQVVERSIPDKYTRVKAGTKIIDHGEKVTSRHLSMLQSMKDQLNEDRMLWEPLPIISSILLSSLLIVLSAIYFYLNRPEVIKSLQKLSLLVSIVIITLSFAKLTEFALLHNALGLFDAIRYPLILPFATILIVLLLSAPVALYISAFLAIVLSMALAVDHTRFLTINLIAALVVIISTKALHKRKEVFLVCGKVYLCIIPVLFSFAFASNNLWTNSLGGDLISAFLFLIISAIVVVGLLPVLESSFRVMTDMMLMEFMDPSNELIRRLAMEIPGTYQHCLVLGNLAEAMAQSIGANGLFCRVATLYHDVGKLNNPQFFTENQASGVNIHQLLTPVESAQVIISHVTDGEVLARKYRLPKSFINVIKEHHGTTLVYYFYCKELELKGGNADEVDEKQFRYPGPKPKTKESAIIMIADTVEAASRTLEEPSEEKLTELVERLVKDRIEDGQFEQARLTFAELETVKKTLVKNLLLAHHIRVKYPEKKPLKPATSE